MTPGVLEVPKLPGGDSTVVPPQVGVTWTPTAYRREGRRTGAGGPRRRRADTGRQVGSRTVTGLPPPPRVRPDLLAPIGPRSAANAAADARGAGRPSLEPFLGRLKTSRPPRPGSRGDTGLGPGGTPTTVGLVLGRQGPRVVEPLPLSRGLICRGFDRRGRVSDRKPHDQGPSHRSF